MKYTSSQIFARLFLVLIVSVIFAFLANENILKPMSQAEVDNPTYINIGDTVVISTTTSIRVSMYSYSEVNPGSTKLYNQNDDVVLETLPMADPDYYEVNGVITSGTYTIVGNSVWLKINEEKSTYTLSNPNREEFLSDFFSFYTVVILIGSGCIGSFISVVIFGVYDIITKKENT